MGYKLACYNREAKTLIQFENGLLATAKKLIVLGCELPQTGCLHKSWVSGVFPS